MTAADLYRVKALEFSAMASAEKNLHLQIEYARMAAAYFRLADLADKNQQADIVYETPVSQGT